MPEERHNFEIKFEGTCISTKKNPNSMQTTKNAAIDAQTNTPLIDFDNRRSLRRRCPDEHSLLIYASLRMSEALSFDVQPAPVMCFHFWLCFYSSVAYMCSNFQTL